MVSLSILFALISACICLGLPTAFALVMILKYKASWKAFVLGIAVFTVFQLLTRIQILAALGNDAGFVLFTQTNMLAYVFLLALSAGVFEEMGRFVGMRFFMKDGLTWKNGIVFGLGHGGVEAFVLVGLPYLNVLTALFAGDTAYTSVAPAAYLVGGIERVLTLAIHIGLTMLVLYAVKRKRIRYLVFAILLHAAVDFGAPLLAGNTWVAEGYVAAFAVLFAVITWRFKKKIETSVLQPNWRF